MQDDHSHIEREVQAEVMAEGERREREAAARAKRFRILVCIDGSDESYRGLRYAVKMGSGAETDIILLYVRPIDHGMRSGGLDVRVARENMLNWGIELPGIKYLQKGKALLEEMGRMSGDWKQEFTHLDVEGDPLGDNKTVYTAADGHTVVLKLKTASNIAVGILDQYELGPYNLIIIGASSRWRGMAQNFWDPAVAEKVAIHAPCSVLVARELDVGHGHLICTDGSENSMQMVRKDALIASRCECPISLISVAFDDEGEAAAKDNVERAKKMLAAMDIAVEKTFVRTGNAVEHIVGIGCDFSVIAVSDTGKTGLTRFFMGSVAFKVLNTAHNSVMIVR